MKNRLKRIFEMSVISLRILKIFIFSIAAVIMVFSMCGCIDNHEMTEEEQQSTATIIRAHYDSLPELMQEYVAETSLDELSECNPSYDLFRLYNPREYHSGMFKSYSLDLKDGALLILRYGMIKDEKLVDHAVFYKSPYFPCDTLEELLPSLKNHAPLFEDDLWIDEVVDDFYPVDTDIRGEWKLLYDKMVQEIEENGIPLSYVSESSYLYMFDKIVLVTENGNYNFRLDVKYDDTLSMWYYMYGIQLEAVK